MMSPPARRLRIAAIIEASTFLILITGVVIRVAFDGPRLGPTIGPIHGASFTAYAVTVLQARTDKNWSVGRTALVVFAAVVPIGGYLVAHRLVAVAPNHDNPGGPRVSSDSSL
jgi:integral membrane protein